MSTREQNFNVSPDTLNASLQQVKETSFETILPTTQLNYSHLKWEFVWEPLEAVRVISYLSNRSSKRLSSFS